MAVLMVWLLVPALSPTWWDAGYWHSDTPAMALSNAVAPLAEDQIAPWLGHQRSLPQDETPSHEAGVLAFVERAFPSVADKLGQRAHFVESISGTTKGWRPTHEPIAPAGLKPEEQKAWVAMAARQPSAAAGLELFFPEIFTRPHEVAADGLHLEVQAVGARSVRGQVVDGRMVYAEAWHKTDVFYTSGTDRSEEFLFLHDSGAPTSFAHRLVSTGPSQLSDVFVLADGSVRVEDSDGRCVHIERPYVVDARGKRSETAVKWRVESRHPAGEWALTMDLCADGLMYPLLIDPTWTTAPYMNRARGYHTATLLRNGTVLVVGGVNGSSNAAPIVGSEIYDPASGSWKITGSLIAARRGHSATLLLSGKVLVVGGSKGNSVEDVYSNAEIYDPNTGIWSPAGSLATARIEHTATLLLSGRVLVTGDAISDSPSNAEIFDPIAETWAQTGIPKMARSGHSATLVPSGKVLIVGGRSGNYSVHTSVEIYDPVSGTWEETTPIPVGRTQHSAVLLSGKVLVAGGFSGSNPLSNAQVFDPIAKIWTGTGALKTARYGHATSILPSGKVLIVGGYANSGTVLMTTEIFDPILGTWAFSSALTSSRENFAATLLSSGAVLISGGYETNSGYLNTAETLDLAVGAWSGAPPLENATSKHSLTTLLSGDVLVAGGSIANGTRLATSKLFNPSTGTWISTGNLGIPRSNHTATLLQSGKVLLVGEGADSNSLASAELFDPETSQWSSAGDLASVRQGHTATLLQSGKVLIVGGFAGCPSCTGYLSSAEVFNPLSGSWTIVSSMSAARYLHTATLLPSGKVLVVGGIGGSTSGSNAEIYNPLTDTWTSARSPRRERVGHTASMLPSGKVLLVGGDQSAGASMSAEIYDPVTDSWSITTSPAIGRGGNTATTIPTGNIVLVGGYNSVSGFLSHCEVFDPYAETWLATAVVPTARAYHTATILPSGGLWAVGGSDSLSTFTTTSAILRHNNDSGRIPQLTSLVQDGSLLTLTGSGFFPFLSSVGSGTQAHSANHPCVQIQRLEDGRLWFLDSVGNFSDTQTGARIPSDAVGPCSLRVIVNGIFSPALYANIQQPRITMITSNKINVLDNGDTATLTIHLGRPYNLPVSLELQTTGTAISPDDFMLGSHQLTIPAGETQVTTIVTGRNLNRVSGDRGFTVTVASVTNGLNSTPSPSVDLTITSSNHAPVIASTNNVLPGIVGGQTSADTPVTTLLFGKITDLDPTDGKGIAVTGLSGSGTWWFTINNGAVWTEIGSVSDTSALLLSEAGSTQVRYESIRGSPEIAAITYRAWDRTSRNEGELVNVTVNGGATAFSTGTSRTTIQVDSQAAPVVTFLTTTASWTEGTAPLQIDGGATCTDADSPTFSGGNITVTMTPNNRIGDRLDYDSALTGGIVRTAAELRTTDGTLLGTLSGGNDGAPLIIALTAATTPAIAQTMLRGLTYANIGGNPEATPTGTGQRTIVISVDDETAARGTSQAKVVTVQAVDGTPIVEPLTVSLVPGLKVSNQLIARDPEGLGLTFVLESNPSKGDATLDPNSGLITYHNTVLDGQNDSFQVRVSDGLQTTLSTVTVQVTAGDANGFRFTSVAPLVWRSGVVLSYTPTITGTTATVRYSLVPPPQEAKTGNPLVPTTHYLFQTETGTVKIEATLPHPDGNYLRFGILAVDTVNGTSAYQPVLIKFLVAGSG